jgi:predicted ribosome quality control (RQC) complex YloA/Tae2 family protein
MSRQREIAPGLRYERPPSQERPSLYTVNQDSFLEAVQADATEINIQNSGNQVRLQKSAPLATPDLTANPEQTPSLAL